MCGRYNLEEDIKAILDAYRIIVTELDELEPNYNVPPTSLMPMIRIWQDARQLQTARWGLVPFTAKEMPKRPYHNGRCESVFNTFPFKLAINSYRCVIPATGWYEWRKEDKQPFYHCTGEIISFAGIYSYNKALDTLSYSIVTTDANSVAVEYHPRMPVILSEQDIDTWMHPDSTRAEFEPLMRPYQGNDLRAYAVDKKVGNVRYNEADCRNPIKS